MTHDTEALTKLIDEQKRYNTLLQLNADLSLQINAALKEARVASEQSAEALDEARIAREQSTEALKDAKKAFGDAREHSDKMLEEFRQEVRQEFKNIRKDQQATFELLGDMAQSISDRVLEKKARRKATELKRALT